MEKSAEEFKAEVMLLLPRMRRFARCLTRSDAAADDLLAQACAAALARWPRPDPAVPLDRWLLGLVRECRAMHPSTEGEDGPAAPLLLVRSEGYTYREAAAVLGVSVTAVARSVHQARTILVRRAG